MQEDIGIVYILTNPAMPGMVKIGLTRENDVTKRLDQLYTSGVPFPFECEYAARVKSVSEVENALHTAFVHRRINPKREFFEIETVQAVAIIKLLQIENVTPGILAEENTDSQNEVDKDASDEFKRKKRPLFNFQVMGIETGSIIVSLKNGEEAVVVDERQVQFREETMSLNKATRLALNLSEESYNVQGTPYWTYDGKKLIDIYNSVY